MQTKHQIQDLLSSAGVAPNRRLGQHFLIDLNLMRLLVDSADPGRDDVVLEVGCGTGSLTQALAERAGAVVAVEIDRTLGPIAQAQLAGCENVQIVNSDVLLGKGSLNPAVVEALERASRSSTGIMPVETDDRQGQDGLVTGTPNAIHRVWEGLPPAKQGRWGPEPTHGQDAHATPGRLLLVSNLPYDVASPVMIDLVEGPLVADAMAITVQKEVAERMVAGPGSRDYGTLSIFLQAAGEVEILRILKPSVFWPAPGVDSAMVRFVRNEQKVRRIEDMAILSDVVWLFMGHRRKMLRACLKTVPPALGDRDLWLQILAEQSVDATLRPGDLSPGQYVDLANACRRRTGRRDRT